MFLLLFAVEVTAQPEFSQINSAAGAFSRLGFGARGMGMGNALSAVKEGNLVAYYNPALAVFQEGNSFQTSYSFLSLDRSLNFLNFTRRFDFGVNTDAEGKSKPRSTAGLSVGIINAGVSKIDVRDNQGIKTGDLSTSENQFFISVSNKFSSKFAVGVSFKFYYYKLYESVTSSGLGFDIGALYSFNDAMTLSFVFTDIKSAYSWDTGSLFGQDGRITKDQFPLIKKIGLSYKLDDPKILAAVEFESSNAGTNILRGGIEYNIYQDLFIRTGLDKLNLSNTDIPVRPTFGFSYFYTISNLKFGVDYAFVIEPYSSNDQHIVGINILF